MNIWSKNNILNVDIEKKTNAGQYIQYNIKALRISSINNHNSVIRHLTDRILEKGKRRVFHLQILFYNVQNKCTFQFIKINNNPFEWRFH